MRWLVVVLVLTSSCAGKLEHDAAHDFGAVLVGASVVHPITLRNAGAAAIDVVLSSEGEVFTVEDARVRIAPGAVGVVGVRFAPARLGDEVGALTLEVGAQRSTVALKGVGAGASARVASRSIDFGTVLWLDDKPSPEVRLLRVTNDGVGVAFTPDVATVGTELCIGAHVDGACQPWQPTPLEPGASVDVPISFLPTAVGGRRWTVNVRGAPVTIEVDVTAEVIEGERCSLVVEPIDQRVGASLVFDAEVRLLWRQVGTKPCLVSMLELHQPLDGIEVEADTPWLLHPGDAREATVRRTRALAAPTTWVMVRALDAVGERLAHFFFTFARDRSVCLSPAPSVLEVGEVGVRCSSHARNIQLYNVCDFPLTLTSVDITGSAFAWASLPAAGTVLSPGATPLALQVGFQPPSPGAFRGSVSLGIDGEGFSRVDVSGVGVSRELVVQRHRLEHKRPVEVLLAVDASPSFVARRAELRARLAALTGLMRFASCSDFQISLIPADGAPDASVQRVASGAGATVFSPTEDGGLEALQDALDRLPVGSETESCVAAVESVAGVADAGLLVLCVTDAREHAMNAAQRAAALRTRRAFVNWHTVGPFGPDTCGFEEVDDGVHQAVLSALYGSDDSVCHASWWPGWGGIGVCDQRQFFLAGRPAPGTGLTIAIDGQAVPPVDASGDLVWSYDATNGSVVFSSPPAGASLELSYLPACVSTGP